MKPWARFLLVVCLILGLGPGFWIAATSYVEKNGAIAEGEITERREEILMPGGDSWQHVFEVTYSYRPFDSPYRQTGGHRVDSALYHRLQVGSPVLVRYSRSPLLRRLEGVGSFLAVSSTLSRLPSGPSDCRDLIVLGAVAPALLVGCVAYRIRSRFLASLAVLIGGVGFPVVLFAFSGLVLFPALFRVSRDRKDALALLAATIGLTVVVLYWRIPQPTPMPPPPRFRSTAIVRQAREVNQLWWLPRTGGQPIRQPFIMLDLEFTPQGAREPIHVLDRVDANSVAGLHPGVTVPIDYSEADPALVRIVPGTRRYAGQALVYLLGLTYGIGVLVAAVAVPVGAAAIRLLREGRAALKSV